MKLTTKSEYSILALIHIARFQGEGNVTVDEICSRYQIPPKYLEQLLTTLKQNGLIKAKRGAGGGYRLAKPASQIDLARIVRIFDGALAPTDSASKYFFAHTPLEQEKKVLKVMLEIRDLVANRLEKLKLTDLI